MVKEKYLGIDIGGTSGKYGIVQPNGCIIEQNSFPTGKKMSQKQLLSKVFEVVDDALLKGVAGVGISTLGIVNSETGKISGGVANLPSLKTINLKQALAQRYPRIPLHICNDVQAVAKAEQRFGAGKNCSNFFCITFGTGLGGCAVVNSEIVQGAHFRAGEIGYLNYTNEHNYCEHYLSTGFVMKHAAQKLGIAEISGVTFFEKLQKKDSICMEVFDEWITNISRLIANIIILLDTQKVILGGGISVMRQVLLDPINEKLQSMLPIDFRGQASVEISRYEKDAGILGSVCAFFD